MCTIAFILSGLPSITFIDTMNPSTLPFYRPNTHFSGLSFSCALRMFANVFAWPSI
jgi:hypothetical protein